MQNSIILGNFSFPDERNAVPGLVHRVLCLLQRIVELKERALQVAQVQEAEAGQARHRTLKGLRSRRQSKFYYSKYASMDLK